MKHSRDEGARSLTLREMDVALLVTQGKRDAQIADELGLSVLTVQSHLHHIYIKLGLHSRTQLGHWMAERISNGK